VGRPRWNTHRQLVVDDTVMCIPIARQRLSKHIPTTHAHTTIGHLLLGNGVVNTLLSMGFAPRLYNEDLTQLELDLGQVLEMAVEGSVVRC
jgi:hypothetical protein